MYLLQRFHNGYGAKPASYRMGIGLLSPEVKQQERKADLSYQSHANITNDWWTNYKTLLSNAIIACHLDKFLYVYSVKLMKQQNQERDK